MAAVATRAAVVAAGRVVSWVASSVAAGWRDALTVAVMSHIAS